MHPFPVFSGVSLFRVILFTSLLGLVATSNGCKTGRAETRGFNYILTVNGSPTNGKNVVVKFDLPAGAPVFHSAQMDGSNGQIPVQVVHGKCVIIIPQLTANGVSTFRLLEAEPSNALSSMQLETKEDHLLMGPDLAKPTLDYTIGKGKLPRSGIKESYRRAGFFHPLRTPSGLVISDSYATNHLHHHGIWFSWTKTEFQGRNPDFWNVGDNKGTTLFDKVDSTWSGSLEAGFIAGLNYLDFTSGKSIPALTEKWEVSEYAFPPAAHYSLLDLKVTDNAIVDPLILPTYHYGGLGFRGLDSWNGAGNWKVLTSEGVTDRVKANETKARWCYLGGMTEGKQAGIVIMSAPSNFRDPQPIRVHPSEPFFCYAPSQGGDWSIIPGKPYISQYRMILLDGAPNAEEIERLYQQYAHPVHATVEKR
ncbi:MAG: hypothetical protein JWN25_2017 [Verrucomicrobiales bacterium]|nr:hypothetical protein [Verrucomicrobiales bacterium]